MSFGIIVKNYEHFNRALGKYIGSKKEYEYEMAKGNYIPFDKAEKIAEKRRKEMYKNYDRPSEKAIALMKDIKNSGKNGKIKLSDRQINAMKEVGVNFNARWLPSSYKSTGGIESE